MRLISLFRTSVLLIVGGLGFVAPASASTVVVDARANSTTGGVGADAGFLSGGQSYTVTVPVTDFGMLDLHAGPTQTD